MTQMRLLDMKSGPARVVELDCDAERGRRLEDLGLRPGVHVEIVQHNGEAGVVIAVSDDGRLTLDAETAQAVRVRPLEPRQPALTLADLAPGDRARIVGLGKGASAYRHHLMSMGLTPGVELEIVRAAPLGDPVEIRVRGFSISLRREEARLVSVERA